MSNDVLMFMPEALRQAWDTYDARMRAARAPLDSAVLADWSLRDAYRETLWSARQELGPLAIACAVFDDKVVRDLVNMLPASMVDIDTYARSQNWIDDDMSVLDTPLCIVFGMTFADHGGF